MKQFLAVIQNRRFQLILFLTLITIWFLGPYLAIADNQFCETIAERMAVSVIAFFILLIIEYQRSSNNISKEYSASSVVLDELQELQTSLQKVLRILYKGPLRSFLFRYRKPWYLILGPSNSGKSTLLNKASLNIKGLDNLPPLMITPTKSFDWWLADEAVFIDVSGCYLRDTKDPKTNTEQLFQGFFRLLKRYRAHSPINGLLLTINLQELAVNPQEQIQLKNLRQIINEMLLQCTNVPIYLLITRSDIIEGFVEFFEDLSLEERQQIFGISFPLSVQPQDLPQLFNEQFNLLLTRLNKRIIRRINQEHQTDKMGKIKNFPLQMEFLKNPLAKLLNVILPNTNVNLRGIFFTSSAQKDTPYDNLTKTLSQAYDIPCINSGHRFIPSRDFFIYDIFKRIIFPETKFYAANSQDQSHLVINALIFLFSSVCGFLFFNSYQYNQRTIHHAQRTLEVKQQDTLNANHLTHRLNLLQLIVQQLSYRPPAWYDQIGMLEASKLKVHAQTIYNDLLTTKFINYLQQSLEQRLQTLGSQNINQLYATLKTYLMLTDQRQFDRNYFISWFKDYWHETGLNHEEQRQLTGHLEKLLAKPLKTRTLNIQLIENARAILNSLPQSRLVLTILQNQYQAPIKILPESVQHVLNNLPREISGIYNIQNFRQVYYQEITKTCQEISSGNWILNKKPQHTFSDIALNQLASEVKAIYLNEYAVIWSDIYNKIRMPELRSLTEVIEMINLLNDPQSPLMQLINTIKNNTQPLSDSVVFTQEVSVRFLPLLALSADLSRNNHQPLVAVKQYLNQIITANDKDKMAYEAAKERMEQQNTHDDITNLLLASRLLPEPLQTWHTLIAAESWRIMLQYAQNFLNRIWVTTVHPQYMATINNRYPLFKEAATDIPLNEFANFFGNNGVMDTFFKNYLQPFVDNSKLYWEWKNIDGQRINIPQPSLEMFIRAALIQKMFFPEESKLPTIAFSLVPVELDPNVQSFTLELEGQSIVFQKDNEQIIALYWPGPQPNHTQIALMDSQGKRSTLMESGPWSWFRLLDKSLLESTSNPKHFRLTFQLNGSAVHYELYTSGIVNPFIMGILNAFRCPETLL